MPAPLGKVPTRKMPKIDVFGLEDSAPTRAAIRFFRERRIVVSYVDLRKKPIDLAELRGFVSRLGIAALLDDERAEPGPADGGGPPTGAADLGRLVVRIHADAHVLRLPLVRHGDELTAGTDEVTWKAWLARRG